MQGQRSRKAPARNLAVTSDNRLGINRRIPKLPHKFQKVLQAAAIG